MDDIEEFAVEYTAKERKRILIFGVVLGAIVVFAGKTWISPWFNWFVKTAHCHSFLGHSGIEIVFFAVFVGVPCLGILPFLNLTWMGYRILRERQAPPKGTKVFQKTRIAKGKRAILKGAILFLIVPVVGIPFVTWGYLQAVEITKNVKLNKVDYSICRSIGSANLDPTR